MISLVVTAQQQTKAREKEDETRSSLRTAQLTHLQNGIPLAMYFSNPFRIIGENIASMQQQRALVSWAASQGSHGHL